MKKKWGFSSALMILSMGWAILGCGTLPLAVNLSDALVKTVEPPRLQADGKAKEPQILTESHLEAETALDVPVSTASSTVQVLERTYTATPDLRTPPEQWRDWPIVPTLTNRAVRIYRDGLVKGNNPNAFSKVGDCHCVNSVFFGIYDRGWYSLPEESWYLNETIDHFEGSFNRESAAVHGGFTGASVLSPLWADSRRCERGETPLACELRLHQPSIVIISLEVWWSGRNAQSYSEYMRQVLDEVIAFGAVPILATKADNVEGDHSINLATARLAYEYDLPLWNFWRAVQGLEGDGIDTSRDNFHLTVEAWDRRSFTGLKALDSVWRGLVEAQKQAPIEEVEERPTATIAQTDLPAIESTAIVETATQTAVPQIYTATQVQVLTPWPTFTPGPVLSPTPVPGENRKD